MYDNELAAPADEYGEQAQPPSIYRLVRAIYAYRVAILLGLVAVISGYALVAAILVLRAPSQRVVTLPFRLEFAGAGEGRYPNGLKFSNGDIVAAPIVNKAFAQNGLDQFVPLSVFAQSLVVLDSNPALDRLTSEYRARLADPRLTPVDRERISEEFQQKSASLTKNEWTLSLTIPDRSGTVPPTVAKKVLHDVLKLWAEDAAATRNVLKYEVGTLSTTVFHEPAGQDEIVVSLMRLRSRITSLLQYIERIGRLPGAELTRTAKSNSSLDDLRLILSDLLRDDVEPLIAHAIQAGAIRDRAGTLTLIAAQRDFDLRRLQEAQRRAEVQRAALADYLAEQPSSAPPSSAIAATPSPNARPAQGNETIMPQLNESFLDRLVQFANNAADRDYRQRTVDDIREASLVTLPLQSTVAFDEQIAELARAAPAGGTNAATEEELRSRYRGARTAALQALAEINEIYATVSRNLHPSGQLYQTTGPATVRIERTLSFFRLAVGGGVAFLLAMPILIAAALLHHRFVRNGQEADAPAPAVEA